MNLLINKFALYLKLLPEHQDKYGFIDTEHCDSLLFSGLLGCCDDVGVVINAAFDSGRNEWQRRPIENPCCYDETLPINKEGVWTKLWGMLGVKLQYPQLFTWHDLLENTWYRGSTISRDMLIGLAWYAWHNKRLDISENVIKRAISNFGVMGRGDPARINIMPPLLSTFAWISYKLGGPSRPWLRHFPISTAKVTGFQAHLQVLHIMLRRDVSGKISDREMKALAYQSTRQPRNALFQAAVGKKEQALHMLLLENLWPSGRLPDESDRSEPWLFQRDYGDDWLPDDTDDPQIHTGADFIFLYSYLTGRMKNG